MKPERYWAQKVVLMSISNSVSSDSHPPLEESKRLHQQALNVLPGGNSRHSIFYKPFALYAESGKGCRVTDVDGIERIDCINNMSSLIHGHSDPDVLEAVLNQAKKMLSVGMPTLAEIELAAELCQRLTSFSKVRFCNSGTESIMFAIRAARCFTGRDKVAKIEGAYHGSYDAMEYSLTPTPDSWGPAESPTTVPACEGMTQNTSEDTIILPFNNVAATREILRARAKDLAAVMIDPLVSHMAFTQASPDYLAMVREETQRLGIVLIFDEVFSFRIGYRGAQSVVGIEPDLTTLGKVIGGGLPIGAIGGHQNIMAVFDGAHHPARVEHSGTFFGNPLSTTAGLAALKKLTPQKIEYLQQLGDSAREGFKKLLVDCKIAGQVTGAGSLLAVILNDQPFSNYREFADVMMSGAMEKRQAFHRAMLNEGVHIIPGGGLILSTAMTPTDIEQILDAGKRSLQSIR